MTTPRQKFNLDDLVTRLRLAAKGNDPRAATKTILEDAVKDPQYVQGGIPTFEENDTILFEDNTVSMRHRRFMLGSSVPAHNHQMSATIGLYQGAERNDFFENDPNGGIRKSSEVDLSERPKSGFFNRFGSKPLFAASAHASRQTPLENKLQPRKLVFTKHPASAASALGSVARCLGSMR